jgi:hypothetical protein
MMMSLERCKYNNSILNSLELCNIKNPLKFKILWWTLFWLKMKCMDIINFFKDKCMDMIMFCIKKENECVGWLLLINCEWNIWILLYYVSICFFVSLKLVEQFWGN